MPADGAQLIFPCGAGGTVNLENTLTAKVAKIETVKGSGGSCTHYVIDKMNFMADVQFTGTASDNYHAMPDVQVKQLTGIKNLTANNTHVSVPPSLKLEVDNFEMANQGCSELPLRVKSKNTVIGSGAGVSPKDKGSITVKSGGTLGAAFGETITYANNVVFEGGSKLGSATSCLGGFGTESIEVTLSGDITLNGDVEYDLGDSVVVKIVGKLSGPGKFVQAASNEGRLVIASSDNTSGSPNSEQGASNERETIYLDDESSDSLRVKSNQTVFLNGKRGLVSVTRGGILKGNAIVDSLHVSGTVAPGNSPGKITVLTSGFSLDSTGAYEAEFLDKDQYDQIVVQAGGVYLTGSLKLVYVPGGKVSKGETFTIIDNRGTGSVNGTFNGLPEGAEVVADGAERLGRSKSSKYWRQSSGVR